MGSIYRQGDRNYKLGKGPKPKGPYWIAWTDTRGIQHKESTRMKGRPGSGYNFDAAKRLLQEREGDVSRGLPITGKTGKLKFTDALQDVITDQEVNGRRAIDGTKRRITLHVRPYFEGRRIAEVTTSQIRGYVAARKKAGAKPATINRELAIIRRAFRLAYRAGHILTIPHVELLDESRNVRQGFIEPHDFARVLAGITPASYADAAETTFVTGWRMRSEVLTLTWGQVDTRAGIMRIDVGVTKGGEGRTFPLTARLRAILEQRRAALPEENREQPPADAPVFTDTDGKAIHYKRFYAAWSTACTAAGFPDLIPHDLRRSAVREMERRRIPRQVSMKLIGHRTESIFRRYAIVTEADILDAGARLDQPASTPNLVKSDALATQPASDTPQSTQ